MPRKKVEKIKLSEKHKIRSKFNRARHLSGALVVTEEVQPPLFPFHNSIDIRPQAKLIKKKKATKKVFASPNVSVEHVSSDEEDAGKFKVPDADVDEDEKARKMNAEFDVNDYSSYEIFNDDGVRVNIVEGKHIVCDKQPPPAWRPGVREDYIGNFPKLNKPPKKAVYAKKEAIKEAKPRPVVVPEPPRPMTIYQSLCHTLNAREAMKAAYKEKKNNSSFRVFTTPTRNKILVRKALSPNYQTNNSALEYAPICDNTFDQNLTDLIFAPKNASTPKTENENKTRSKKTNTFPVFRCSDEEDSEKPTEEQASVSSNEISETNRIISAGSILKDQSTLKVLETENTQTEVDPLHVVNDTENHEEVVSDVQDYMEDDNDPTSMSRKAETSVTELLNIAEREESTNSNQGDNKYSKKRQRTLSPDTMQQGTSTMLTMQNDQDDIEKENAFRKRGTLQPQQRQLDRESRVRRLSAMSSTSAQESIISGMGEMSLDFPYQVDDTLGDELGKTNFSESRAESRNIPTGMTIHNDDPSILPFYLADGTFESEPTIMAQLLHVAGQKEAKTWNSLPKSALNGKHVKKLGEGSYGEVFATIWEGKPVAIKVVPFEADENNRLYTGEYHSEQMQTSNQILPELIVMKELNQLKSLESESSTPNFIEMIAAEIVTGNYPKGLLKAWDSYAKTKESENTRPNIYSSVNQNFIVLVSANGGVALEDFTLQSEEEIFSILIQLSLSMLAAEPLLEFEHRDMHLGNILIDRNGVEALDYKISGHRFPVKAHGVKVNIIDFTLSRISKGPTTVFLDLEQDPGIFEGTDDPQFDVYREMRKNCKRNWKDFNPRTNLMWIEFIANRLLEPDICPEKLLTKKRKKEIQELVTRLGTYETCQGTFVDPEFFNKFYEGHLGDVAQQVNQE